MDVHTPILFAILLSTCIDFVLTVTSVELVEGDQGVIPCGINQRVSVVLWRKVGAPSNEYLVILNQNDDPGEKSGLGYEAGFFNITNDFSLVINEVKQEDAGQYVCTVFNYAAASTYQIITNVSIHEKALSEGSSSASLPTESTASMKFLTTTNAPFAGCCTKDCNVWNLLLGLCATALCTSWLMAFGNTDVTISTYHGQRTMGAKSLQTPKQTPGADQLTPQKNQLR
ncbi:uncharacterized protein [Diadema antillarum]|uniref:uncharacterized protein isoform X2 n=1 Tax=Diadema antillarum TaxID=105358 RepID=UPI003A83EF9A